MNKESDRDLLEAAAKREAAFRADLKLLLEAHGAEMEITDDHKPYGMHRGIVVITMDSEWVGDTQTKEFTEFRL